MVKNCIRKSDVCFKWLGWTRITVFQQRRDIQSRFRSKYDLKWPHSFLDHLKIPNRIMYKNFNQQKLEPSSLKCDYNDLLFLEGGEIS